MRRVLLAAVGISACASLAVADPVIWDNYPLGNEWELNSSQLDVLFPFHSQTADDFRFESPGEPWAITGVVWSGGYWHPGPNTTAFNIFFYADDGTGHSPTGGPGDPSGTALMSYTIPIDDIVVTPGSWTLHFDYSTELPQHFVAENYDKYWIAIQSVNLFPPQWGIADATASQQLHGAVEGFPMLQIPYWTDIDDPVIDVAFRLTGYQVPEPSALALAGIGAGLLLRRRRSRRAD